jgi:hypothetical protein
MTILDFPMQFALELAATMEHVLHRKFVIFKFSKFQYERKKERKKR